MPVAPIAIENTHRSGVTPMEQLISLHPTLQAVMVTPAAIGDLGVRATDLLVGYTAEEGGWPTWAGWQGRVVWAAEPGSHRVVGLLTPADLWKVVSRSPAEMTVADVMTTPIICLQVDGGGQGEDVTRAIALIQQHSLDILPIVDESKELLGCITPLSLLQSLSPAEIITSLEAKPSAVRVSREKSVEQSSTGSFLSSLPSLVPASSKGSVDAAIAPPSLSPSSIYEFFQSHAASYWLLMEGSRDAMVLADEAGRTLAANASALELFGYTEADLSNLSVTELFAPEERLHLTKAFQELVRSGDGPPLETLILRQDGTSVPVEITGSRIELSGKVYLQGSFRDIRHRKQAERCLLASEKRYRAIVEDQMDLICRFTAEGNLTFANRAYCQYFHIDPDCILEQSVWQFLPESDRPRIIALLKTLTPERPTTHNEQQVVTPEGEVLWQCWTDRAIFDDDGNLLEYQSVGHDITDRKRAELALQESETRYRAIVEDQTEMICRFRPDGSLSFANASYRRYFNIDDSLDAGAPAENAIWQYVPEDELNFVRSKVLGLTPDRPSVTYEHRVCLPDGTTAWQMWTDRAIYDEQGVLREYQSVGRDITDRKQAELALQESEDKLKLFVKYVPAAVAMFDTQMYYIAASDRWRQDYKLGDRPLIGESHYDVFPEIPPLWREVHQRSLTGGTEIRDEDPFVRLDGSIDWVRWEVHPWRRSDGQIGGIIMFTEVITERKQAQEKIRNVSARLDLAIKSAGIGIWEWDLVSDRLVWDDRMFELYGLSAQDSLCPYRLWAEHVYPEDLSEAEVALQAAIAHNREYEAEFRVRLSDGAVRHIRAFGKLQPDEQGKLTRMVGVNYDVTKRREAERKIKIQNQQLSLANAELERVTRLKDEFLANMSHELRTPLNAILGLSEGLQEGVFAPLNAAQQKAIATISRSGQHLLDLINDILDLSKIESGKLELQLAPVVPTALCESCIAFIQPQAQQKNITLTWQHDPLLSPFQADERRVRQILINLLINAVKFTAEGGRVNLSVKMEANSPLNGSPAIVFSVSDTGIGIAESDRPKLFQTFVQIDSRLNRQHAGTGLGLALVKRFAELHGGQVAMESAVGEGSCFRVYLPYQPLSSSSSSFASAPLTSNPAMARSRSVSPVPLALVVEDAPTAADQMCRYLGELGMLSHVCSLGEDAIAYLQNYRPTLIILDLQLARMSGWDVLAYLQREPNLASIPVIITSVLDEQEQAKKQGAVNYLVKPITRSALWEAIAPLQLGTARPATPPVSPSTVISANPTLLIAEDNPANIATVSDYLIAKGYRLIYASTGREAVEMTLREQPHLILMDIQMPELSGIDAIRQIRLTRSVPIIALTALAMPGDREKCLAAGANDYLTKPVRLKLLTERIHHLLTETAKAQNEQGTC